MICYVYYIFRLAWIISSDFKYSSSSKIFDGCCFISIVITRNTFRFTALVSILCITIVVRNGKIVWEHGWCCWYIPLNFKYLGWLYREYIRTPKNNGFCEELPSENDFWPVLAIFCCYGYSAKACEAVQKVAANQKKISQMLLVCYICWIAKIHQPI